MRICFQFLYRLKTVVYYDDMMLQQYNNNKEKVKGKLRAVMAFVKELYSEKDTLKTVIKVDVLAIEHASGKNWGTRRWKYVSIILSHSCSFMFFLLFVYY